MKKYANNPRMSHPFSLRRSLALIGSAALLLAGFVHAETVVVESRGAGDTASPDWVSVSGTWGKSKNKSRVGDGGFAATNVFSCTAASPAPAFKISPALKSGVTYKVDVTFGTSKTQRASSNLVVTVMTEGVTNSTIPATTTAFQEANANSWTTLGEITATTGKPSLTFTYASGTLSTNPPSRWYADAVRFVSKDGGAKTEVKSEAKTEAKE